MSFPFMYKSLIWFKYQLFLLLYAASNIVVKSNCTIEIIAAMTDSHPLLILKCFFVSFEVVFDFFHFC